MEKGTWFWLIMFLAVLAWMGWGWLPPERRPAAGSVWGLIILLLIGLLGWAVFAPPVR